jgi:DNA-binding IclR family transcriptional regulator
MAPIAADEVGVAAVNRALSVLDAFTQEASILSLAELSEKTALYKSTILRLLQSLEAYGYVQRLSTGSYILGATPIRLATVAKNDMHPAEKVMPVLRGLVQATNESASFYVRSGEMRLCAYRVDSPRSVRDNVQPGQLLPLKLGAAGRILAEFDSISASDTARLKKSLLRVTLGERDAEAAALACPVFGPGFKLEGAVTLSGPIGRFDKKAVAAMSPPLLDAARILTINFQGDPRIFNL